MCLVGHQALSTAYTEYNMNDNGKASVIFRIAAKNQKGYGAAVQIRWLQGMHLFQ